MSFALARHQSSKRFDYDAYDVSAADKRRCKSAITKIDKEVTALNRVGVQRLIAIGKHLKPVHELLSHHKTGVWGQWVVHELGINRMTANRALRLVATDVDTQKSMADHFNVEAALLACDDNTPEDVLPRCITLAEKDGVRITKELVESMIKKDPELLDAEPEDESKGETSSDVTLDDFVKKLVSFLKRSTKDWGPDEIDLLNESVWNDALNRFRG